jgi:hypothetical protein
MGKKSDFLEEVRKGYDERDRELKAKKKSTSAGERTKQALKVSTVETLLNPVRWLSSFLR